MATNNLKTIRAQIEKLTAERAAVSNAIQPVEACEIKLRDHLKQLAAPLDEFITNCGYVLNGSGTGDTTPATPPMLARAAFGMSLTPERIESIVEAARQRATASDAGQLRLSDTEKTERLADLDHKIYALGLEEQTVIGDEQQRRDVSAACVLGIPLDAAIEFNLI